MPNADIQVLFTCAPIDVLWKLPAKTPINVIMQNNTRQVQVRKCAKSHVHLNLTIITTGFSKSSNVEGQGACSLTISILHIHVQKYLQKETTELNMFVTDCHCQHLIRVRWHVCLREKTTRSLVATHNLSHPPVWIFLVKNGNDVTAPQLQLFRLLWLEVVTGNYFWLKYHNNCNCSANSIPCWLVMHTIS